MMNISSVFKRPLLDKIHQLLRTLNWRKMAEQVYEDIKDLITSLTETLQANQLTNNAANEAHFGVKKNTMATCKIRFSGQYDQEAVEEFITAIETFKNVEDISDEDALKGASLLFTGMASIWWQGVRREADTWQSCLRLLREHFAPTKAAYQIYMRIFEEKQDIKVGINLFIVQKRALLAQLPRGRHDEECEIDLIFGLIHPKYRQLLKRDEIRTFRDLLQTARAIEQNNLEVAGGEDKTVKPKRCSYCNYRGHTAEECRRRKEKPHHHQQQPQQQQQEHSAAMGGKQ